MLLPWFEKQMGYVKKVLFDLCEMAIGSINTLYSLLLLLVKVHSHFKLAFQNK